MILSNPYYDGFDRILDSIAIGFGAPTNIKFNTGKTKDMMPACWKVWEEDVKLKEFEGEYACKTVKKGFKAICRTVGIDANDIKVTEEDYGICLKGETEVDGTKYSQHIELPISDDVMANVKSIKYRSKDGLTYIYLEVSTPERNKFKIEKIEK